MLHKLTCCTKSSFICQHINCTYVHFLIWFRVTAMEAEDDEGMARVKHASDYRKLCPVLKTLSTAVSNLTSNSWLFIVKLKLFYKFVLIVLKLLLKCNMDFTKSLSWALFCLNRVHVVSWTQHVSDQYCGWAFYVCLK